MEFGLEHRELCLLQRGKTPLFFDSQGNPLQKQASCIKPLDTPISKGIFEHFMLKEIYEQEEVLTKVLQNRYNEAEKTTLFPEIRLSPEELSSLQHVIFLGCGSSFHAASMASYLFEEVAQIATRVEIASEYRYKKPILFPNTLVIALSQSGETADTIAAMRELKKQKAHVLTLCNVPNSTLAREADSVIFLRAGPEVAVASTKTLTAQLTTLVLLTIFLGRYKSLPAKQAEEIYRDLCRLPQKVGAILDDHRSIQKLSIRYAKYHDFYFLGRGILYPTALEAALKLKEIAYCNAVGYPAGEMKH